MSGIVFGVIRRIRTSSNFWFSLIMKWNCGRVAKLKKKVYVSTYGMPEWDENLISPDFVDPEYNLENLFSYWKKKVFKEKA